MSAFSHNKVADSLVIARNLDYFMVDIDGEEIRVNIESGYTAGSKHRNLYYIDSCRKV